MRTKRTLRTLLIVIPAVAFCQTSPTVIPGVDEPPELTRDAKQPQRLSEPEKLLATVQLEDPDYTAKLLSTIDEVIRQYPEYPNSYSMRVDHKYCANGSEYSGLMDDINNAIKYGSLMPNNTSFLQNLYAQRGKIGFVRGDHQRAIEDLEHAVRLDPDLATFLFPVSPHEPKASSLPCEWNIADFDELAKEYPTDYRVYVFRGLTYESGFPVPTELYAAALVDFQKAIAINPKVGLIYYYLGQNIESTLPAAERASSSSQPTANDQHLLQVYGTALTLDPELVPAYMARANIHIYLKHPSLALNDYDKAIALHPRDNQIYNRRAQLLMDIGKDREAIADFTKAIENCNGEFLLQAYYEQRAEVSLRVGAFGDAINDYSETIRLLLEALVPYSLGPKQFRRLYPEYNALTDEKLSRRLQARLRPAWDYNVFVNLFMESAHEIEGGWNLMLFELYEKRGDSYLRMNDFRRALNDFNRIYRGTPSSAESLERWRILAASSGGDDYYLDVKTIEFPGSDPGRLWLKTVGKKPAHTVDEYEIDCKMRLINHASSVVYGTDGKVVRRSGQSSDWQRIIPDTIGEQLYNGMCR